MEAAGSHDDARRRLTFEEPPASPSGIDTVPPTTTRRHLPPTDTKQMEASEANRETGYEGMQPGETTTQPRRAESIRSGASSVVSRIQQAELQAAERMAVLKKKELEIEAELVRKRLAMEITSIREEEQAVPAEQGDVQERVNEWLQRSLARQPKGITMPSTSQDLSYLRHATRRETLRGEPGDPRPSNDDKEELGEGRSRQRGSTPTRQGIDRLAEVLEKMTRHKPISRQGIELPVFSGAPLDWLPFKAAMRDSTEMYKFSRAENLARLRTSLRGEAKEAVSALLFTASDPERIMATLEQCFGRPEVIIDRTLDDIKKLKPPSSTASDLNSFAIKLQNIVCTLATIDNRGYLQNPMIVREIVEKLSPHLKARWCDYADQHSHAGVPEAATLANFMMKEADRALKYAYTTPKAAVAPPERRAKPKTMKVYNIATQGCLACGNKHNTTECSKVKAMDVDQRWEWAKKEKICFQCLNSKHRRFKCTQSKCGVNECTKNHHRLLHKERPSTETVAAAIHHADGHNVWLKICPVQLKGSRGTIKTYALLDEGSSTTLIDEDLAELIGADGPPSAFAIRSVNAHEPVPNSKRVVLEILAAEHTYTVKARTMKDLTLSRQKIDARCLKSPHLIDIEHEICTEEMKPKLLLGADYLELIISRKIRTGKRGEPVASLTKLGWVIHGTAPRLMNKDDEIVCHTSYSRAEDKDEELSNLVKKHFELDAIGISKKVKPTPSEQRAIDCFNESVTITEGRYQVSLPWRREDITMPPSYEAACKRLSHIEKKMDRSTAFSEKYTAQIENLLKKGYAVPADGTEQENPRQWYLPHFAVTNINKPEKPRLVFDAAAKMNGVSLNDELLEGPDLLQGLAGVLWRFRRGEIGVQTDISEMYLRILIHPSDQPAQMFLWRGKDREGPPAKYRMKAMIFGAKSSPFLAHSVRNHNARKYQSEYPRAVQAIVENHYMDDWLDSFDVEEDALQVVRDVSRIHGQAGFQLAGFNSNNRRVRALMPSEGESATSIEISPQNGRTLGLIWYAGEDKLAFNTGILRVPEEVKRGERAPTKREALSAVMSLFDPLGLVSYYTITAKIILQGLWRLSIEWDEQIPSKDAEDFKEWLKGLEDVKKLRLPRQYAKNTKKRQLHVFCDSSEAAVAVALFWRSEDENEHISIQLAAGRAKVNPLRGQTIPKTELQAALIAARLASSVVAEHKWECDEVTYWTDSKTVLQWLRNPEIKYTPFVAHRVTEITETTDIKQWRYVPTNENVADDATRLNFTVKSETDRWFTGPKFLYRPKEEWPQEWPVNTEVNEEYVMYTKRVSDCIIDMKRFSTYERLLKTMSRVWLFIENCRRKERRALEFEHVERAEMTLIKLSQAESFAEEIERLRGGRDLPARCRAQGLHPFLDAKGLLRASGRANAADVATLALNHPVILDGRHPYTRLLVARAHRQSHHAHNERVVNDLRQQYLIIKLRPTVRTVARNCALCRVRKARAVRPVIGDLPRARLDAFARPYSNCGWDLFGPMIVTIGRRHEKRWGALFTCLTTRAIHIELVATLSADSAIMALRRMAARRGWPRLIYSDNATNFKGADQELRQAFAEWEPLLRDYALNKQLEWRYISPGAAHQGGSWERMIRTVKNALKTVLTSKYPKEEVLMTLLAEVEYTVNARPLTHVPVTRDDPEALTPNHFLLGSSQGLPTLGPCEPADRRHWRAAQGLADEYWRRWIKEYLPELVPRRETPSHNYKSIKVNDLVVVVDPNLPRNVWPRGIVTEIYPGPDGEVRNCAVRTNGGVFRRPTSRLAVLPLMDPADEVAQSPGTAG